MKPKDLIVKSCLEDNLEDEKFVQTVEGALAELIPFKHDCESILEACRVRSDFKGIEFEHSGKISKSVEKLESNYTKRELSLALLHLSIELREKNESKSIKGYIKNLISNPLKADMPDDLKRLLGKLSEMSGESECDEECWKCPKHGKCDKESRKGID